MKRRIRMVLRSYVEYLRRSIGPRARCTPTRGYATVHALVRNMGLALLLIVTLLAGIAGSANAQGNLHWDQYDVEIAVNPDGTFRVTETQTIVFVDGSFHVGFATIPTDRTESIYDIQVSEGGQPYRRVSSEVEGGFQTWQEEDNLNIEWYFPYTSNAQRTFTLAYTVSGGLRYYPDAGQPFGPHDILQWIAIAPDRGAPINHSRVTVRLPDGVDILPDRNLPWGFAADALGGGATTQVDVERGIATFTTTRPLQPNESLEVGVTFEHGAIAGRPSSWQADFDKVDQTGPMIAFLSLLSAIAILVLGPLGLFLLWYTKGRDPEVGLAAEYLAEPPSAAPPGVVGVLVDERADMKDIIATLIDLARRGAVTMEEVQTQGLFGIGFSRDFLFRANPQVDANTLRPYERTLLSKVVGSGEQKLSALKEKFYTSIPTLEKQLYDAAVKEGYFSASPQGVRRRYGALGGVLLFLAFLGAVVLTPMFIDYSVGILFPVGALGLVGVLTLIVAGVMPAKTRKGAEEAAKWRAFQSYLQDLPRFQKVEEATSLFDQYLPYAIAFGFERRWINLFSQANTPPPIWYRPWYGPGHIYGRPMTVSTGGGQAGGSLGEGLAGSLQSINTGLTSLFNQAGQVFRSAPSGSSGGFSGGYRGGGFSGGGFRGGGGGGGGSRGFR